jgi:hypothetical protein
MASTITTRPSRATNKRISGRYFAEHILMTIISTLHFYYLTYNIDKEVTLEEIMEAATEVWEVRRGGKKRWRRRRRRRRKTRGLHPFQAQGSLGRQALFIHV